MSVVSNSFSAIGTGTALNFKHGQTFSYSVTGTFVGTAIIERSLDALTYETVLTTTTTISGKILVETKNKGTAYYRFRCTARSSGTIVCEMRDENPLIEPGYKSVLVMGGARVGATSGWTIPTSSDVYRVATCPASKTAATIILGVGGSIPVGSSIKGFYLLGQVESAGNTVTISASLRKTTAASADIVDALVGSLSSQNYTAQTKISRENTFVGGLNEIISDDKFFYVLLTATTAASTDIDLQGVGIVYEEPK